MTYEEMREKFLSQQRFTERAVQAEYGHLAMLRMMPKPELTVVHVSPPVGETKR